jgi:hypothetical protein
MCKAFFASTIMAILCLSSSIGAQEPDTRNVIPAKEGGRAVSVEVMKDVYEKIKTPFKYGVVLKGAKPGQKVDSPGIFKHGNKWYMTYITFEGAGYESSIAVSDDLLSWMPLGKTLPFQEGTWDAVQAAGYPALQDHNWGGSYDLGKYDDKYWMSYLGGKLKGYEADPLMIGMASLLSQRLRFPNHGPVFQSRC